MEPSGAAIELILGPYRSGKSLRFIERILDACSIGSLEDRGALLVVPSYRYQELTEKRIEAELERRKSPGAVGLRIMPFYAICQKILRRAGVSLKVVPDAVRPAIIGRILAELKNGSEVEALGPIVHFAGTHAAVLELIDEFERAGLTPEDIYHRLSKTSHASSRYMELARIYDRYWQELRRLGYIDQRGLAFKTREILSARRDPANRELNLGRIFIDGFDRFNRLQLQVFSGMSAHAQSLQICFDYDVREANTEEYRWKNSSYAEMKEVFGSRLVEKNELVGDIVKSFSGNVSNVDVAQKFRTLDRYFEVQEIARRVKETLVKGKKKANDILVVFRSLKNYKGTIEAAFDAAGISYFVDEAVRLKTLPVIQFLVRLLNLGHLNFKRAEVIACISSPYFKLTSIDWTREGIAALDEISLESRVVEGRDQWRQAFSRMKANQKIGPNESDPTGEIDSRKDTGSNGAALDEFFDRTTAPLKDQSAAEWTSWIEDLIADYFQPIDAEDFNDPFDSWEEARALSEFRKAMAHLVLEDAILEPHYGIHRISFQSFLHRLNLLVEKANFRKLPRDRNTVTICSAELAPNRSFKDVYVVGLIEGEFPRAARQAGFIGSDEVAAWYSFGIDIRNPRHHPSFEYALFHSLLNRATDEAHLSCCAYDMSGEELIPSFFLTRGEPSALAQLPLMAPFYASQRRPLSPRDAACGWFWNEPSSELPINLLARPDFASELERIEEPLAVARARASGDQFSLFNGYLKEPVQAGLLKVELPTLWSASRLNDYGKCPFRFWVTQMLGAEPYEEPSTELPVTVLGEAYHLALETFYKAMVEKGLTLGVSDHAQCVQLFEEATETAIQWLEAHAEVRRGEFWEYEKREIVFRLNRFFMHEHERALKEQAFTPMLLEAGFGFEGSAPPLAIEADGRKILIRGKIDRIDVAAASQYSSAPLVRLIDYKSGSSRIGREEAVEGRNLQLPLYALAVQRAVMPGANVVQGTYLGVTSGEPVGSLNFRPDSSGDDSQGDILAQVEQHVARFVSSIEQGDFRVAPNGEKVCDKCDHKNICRISEMLHVQEEEDVDDSD